MSKISFTHISMKNRKIGVLPPGSYIRDNPRYYETEHEAMLAVVEGTKGHHFIIKFDDSCFNGKTAHATFSPNEFRRKCHDMLKAQGAEKSKQDSQRLANT